MSKQSATMEYCEIGTFAGSLPRWFSEALDSQVIVPRCTDQGEGGYKSRMWFEANKIWYLAVNDCGRTVLFELLHDVHTEITFEQLLRTFDV